MIRNLFLTFAVLISSLFVLAALPTSYVLAQDSGDAVCETLGQATGNNCESVDESGTSIKSVISGGLNLLTFFAGVATVVMVMIAGFKYLTSQGDASAVSSAKNTLLYALIGIVIVALSQTIIFFFVGNSTSTTRNQDTQQINGPR